MWTSVTDCCIKIVHQFTRRKSVLYVCERVNNNVGGAMAAARGRSARSVPKDPTHGFPIQVSLPDGETSHHYYNPCLRHNGGPEQEEEMTRGFLKPPENKSLSDLEAFNTTRSCSMGVLSGQEDEGARHLAASSSSSAVHPQRSYSTTSSPHHRHSAPLETHYPSRGALPPGSSSFSLSSSSSSMSSSSAVGGSPRGQKASFQMSFFPPFSSREKVSQDTVGRRQNRGAGQRGLGNFHSILRSPTTTTAFADIAVVPCGAADLATPAIEGEVIESPTPYSNVSSRPERRTNSGKM